MVRQVTAQILEIGVTDIQRHEPNAIRQSMPDHTVADGDGPEWARDPAVVAIQPPSVPATFRLPRSIELGSEAKQQGRCLQEFPEHHKDVDDLSKSEDLSLLTPEQIVKKLSL